MKKLIRKNYAQDQSIKGFAIDCSISCQCLCAVCKCTSFLKLSTDSAVNGLNVSNASMSVSGLG